MSEYSLKNLAQSAKRHLKEGFSEEELETEIILSKLSRSEKFDLLDNQEFYKKVEKMLLSDDVIINPIGQLIDYEYYETLDELSKQKYVFSISEQYLETKKVIESILK